MRISDWSTDVCSSALPKAGERLQLPGLAKLLAEFASAGPMLFHGRVGEVVVEHLGALGGFVAREAFLRAVACTMPPRVTNLPDGARRSEERRVGTECVGP